MGKFIAVEEFQINLGNFPVSCFIKFFRLGKISCFKSIRNTRIKNGCIFFPMYLKILLQFLLRLGPAIPDFDRLGIFPILFCNKRVQTESQFCRILFLLYSLTPASLSQPNQ